MIRKFLFVIGTPLRLSLAAFIWTMDALTGSSSKINWRKLIHEGLEAGIEV